jgi:hypothetical protein
MTSALRKYDWLRMKEQWGTKSPDNEKIVAMAAQINALKGHLKVVKYLEDNLKRRQEDSEQEEQGRQDKAEG